MPAEIEIRVHAERTIKDLVKRQMRMADLMPVMREARRMLELANAENFDSHGLPVGGWAPRRSDYGWPIMRRTGATSLPALARLAIGADVVGDCIHRSFMGDS